MKTTTQEFSWQRTLAENTLLMLNTVLPEVFMLKRPADRVFNELLRANRQWGARDRRFMAETLFLVWRRWGVLRRELDDVQLDLVEAFGAKRTPGLSREIWARLAYLAWVLERESLKAELLPPECRFWREDADLKEVPQVALTDYLPEWLVTRLGEAEALKAAESLLSRPPLYLRCQQGKAEELVKELRDAGVNCELISQMPGALKVQAGCRVNVYTLESFQRGAFEVQDLASQQIAWYCGAAKKERWWDACAGAGGKTLALAAQLQNTGTVVAGDIRAWKLDDLRRRARRSGFSNIMCREWNGHKVERNQRAKFDGVLVDAPCSCSGVWRRNPDSLWTLKSEAITETAQLQANILQTTSMAVKPGGVLVYATCSRFEEENSAVVQGFLERNPNFEVIQGERFLTGTTDEVGGFLVDGATENCDTMYMAKMICK